MLSETEKWQIGGGVQAVHPTDQVERTLFGRHPIAADIGGEQRPGPQRQTAPVAGRGGFSLQPAWFDQADERALRR